MQGKKKFELRLGDFEVEEGDVLVLEEWDPKTKEYLPFQNISQRIKRKYLDKQVYYLVEKNNDKI